MKHLDTIILVDDDKSTNFIHKRVISKSDISCHLEVCTSAKSALNLLERLRVSEKKNGILFLDLNMPGMSGWDFLDEYVIVSKNVSYSLSIFVLTTSINPDDKAKISDYPTVKRIYNKPLTLEILKEAILLHQSATVESTST